MAVWMEGFNRPCGFRWHVSPPPNPKCQSAMALQFMCFLCVPWQLLYFPDAPFLQSNKIWNELCGLFSMSLWNSLSFLHSLPVFILCVVCKTDDWDQVEESLQQDPNKCEAGEVVNKQIKHPSSTKHVSVKFSGTEFVALKFEGFHRLNSAWRFTAPCGLYFHFQASWIQTMFGC